MTESIKYEAFLKLETGTHTARINQLLVTPDNQTLITSGADKTIRVWDVETKKQVRVLLGQIGSGSDGSIQAITLSRDGKYVIALAWMYPAGTQDAQDRETEVRVYELATGNLQAGFRYPGTLQDLDFSPDGKYLAIVGNPNETRHGLVMIYETKKVIHGFGGMLIPLASGDLYENDLIPSYVRFIPEKRVRGSSYRLVAAAWEHYRPGGPEYTGRLFWFSFSTSKKLTKLIDKELDDQIAPNSLAVSSRFAIVTAEALSEDKNKKFYCYNHNGQLEKSVDSETLPASPAFSWDENQLIVGQREDSEMVQVKLYDTALGQFPLRSVYFGHDAAVMGTALLKNGIAVSAGGDQNAIHFWNTEHMEGEAIAEINGVGRVLHAIGITLDEQIGFGTRDNLRLKDGDIVLQRAFDLRTMTLNSFPFQDAGKFRRAQKTFEEQRLDFSEQFNWNLGLLPEGFLFTSPSGWYNVSTYGFTEKGSVVAGSPDGKVRYTPRSPEGSYQATERILLGHESSVLDHASCGRWLVTAGADQVLRLWYLEDAEADHGEPRQPALNLFVGADDEWVIWSSSGYYNASHHGDRRIGYHVNRGATQEALYFSSDRFIKTFYRPDLIQAIVKYGSEERAFAELAKQGSAVASLQVAQILPPIVELAEQGVTATKNNVTLTFTVEALSPDRPVTRIWIVQNDRFAWESPKLKARHKVTLPLLPGRNSFKILAENTSTKSTPSIQIAWGPEATRHQGGKTKKSGTPPSGTARAGATEVARSGENTLPGNLYLLTVGVSNFAPAYLEAAAANGYKPLSFAHVDAIAIYNAFAKSKKSDRLYKAAPFRNKAFQAVKATILLNQAATRAGIISEINRLSTIIKKRSEKNGAQRDVLFVFLSGHGVQTTGGEPKLYFWNYDLDPTNLKTTGLSLIDLGQIITSVPADIVLAIDACHSGMAGGVVMRGLDPDELAKRIYAVNERGMYILNASRSEELAHENKTISHGFFTQAILTALQFETSILAEQPGSQVNSISMLGLIAAVQQLVPYYTQQKQTSVCRMYGDLLPLDIYKK
jgi:WD40 repeat protein